MEISPQALAEDDAERLLEEACTQLTQETLNVILCAAGRAPPVGLLACYHALRKALLDPAAGRDVVTALEAALGPSATPPLTALFEKAFFFFGLRRSGNHAVSSWIARHFDDLSQVLLLNSADPAPFEARDRQFSIDYGKYRSIEHDPAQTVLIVTYENVDPRTFPHSRNAGIARQSHTIILLRDLYNTAASIARAARSAPAFAYRYRIRDFPDLWCRYARLFTALPNDWTGISYNEWVTDPAYRRGLQRRLGLPQREVSREAVSPAGGGSSFEGTLRDGQATGMDVLSRWPEMQNDRLFQFLILAEENAPELSARIFPIKAPDRQAWLTRWKQT